MSHVFALDSEKRPLVPIHPGYARWLLTNQKAAVFKYFPFTIIMKQPKPAASPEPLRLKIDPGSKTTGLALVNDQSGHVIWAAELSHRGHQIKKRMQNRRALRRSRHARKTRYRESRFNNRRGRAGKLPPSLESRVQNILTWVSRLRRLCPTQALSMELARFDTQRLEYTEISGTAYQQGPLFNYEVREYLLEKWGHRCAYCGKTGVPLEAEHIVPKARGGSNRMSNLTLACEPCNKAKGKYTAEEFGHSEVQAQARRPLKDAAAVNTTRWVLYERLKATGLPVETGSGARTKWNRTQQNLPKTHWLDAACVGASTPTLLHLQGIVPAFITATGRQRRQMCLMDKHGFPRTKAKGQRLIQGFQTGDIVRAVVPSGKRAGTYQGRIAVKASGAFTITTVRGNIPDIASRYCRLLQRGTGYAYVKHGRGFLSLP